LSISGKKKKKLRERQVFVPYSKGERRKNWLSTAGGEKKKPPNEREKRDYSSRRCGWGGRSSMKPE